MADKESTQNNELLDEQPLQQQDSAPEPASDPAPEDEPVVAIATDVKPDAPAELIQEGVVREGPALLRVSTQDKGEQLVRKGYQFRDQNRSVTVNGRTITGATATHKDMGIILKLKPNWFRDNVILGYYPEKDPYWGEPA